MRDILHILEHSAIEAVKLIPFLFLAYLFMEYLEHHSEELQKKTLKCSGQFGSIIGALLGLVPQCGFSSAAAGLYAARVISLGTLISVFLSTSDEMLVIFGSHMVPISLTVKILFIKLVCAIAFGILTDFVIKVLSKKKSYLFESKIEEFCEREDCHCHAGIVKPALIHTAKIGGFILVFTIILKSLIHFIGEDTLASIILNKPILANILSAAIGLIPNCASSVIISELYLGKILSAGAMISGLLANSGVAIAVLFRTNRPRKNNFLIVAILFVISLVVGIIIDLSPISNWLAVI